MRDFIVPSSANYTEFLRDYLKTNTLPASLNDADEAFECDFKQTFTDYYLMREIGFDTEEMFNIMLPYYIDKATKLKLLFTDIFETGYSITQTNNLTIADSGSGSRSNTRTDNLANSETETTATDRTDNATNSEDITQTNNLRQVIDEDASGKEVNYKSPIGSQNDDLPYNSIEGGKKITNAKDNVQTNTGTITTDKDGTNRIVIDEDISRSKSGTNTGTVSTSESSQNTNSQTNRGTITTVYSKNPKFNSLEAMTKFQDDFKNIVQECLNSFECLFMQIF